MVRIPFFDFDEPEPEPAEDPAVAQAAAEAAHEAADRAAREVLYGREHAYAIRLGHEALTREQPALAAIDRGYRGHYNAGAAGRLSGAGGGRKPATSRTCAKE